MSESDSKKRKAMHPMLVLAVVVVLCALATYIIPAGQYTETVNDSTGGVIIDTDSFRYIERTPVTVTGLFTSFTLGLQNSSDVVFFLLIIGGMFGIINGTGALNASIANTMKKIKGKEFIIVPILMIIFGCGATFCGNFEELLVFVPIVLSCCITAGFDSLMAVGIIFLSAAVGYAGGITNAFTVGTAQTIAGLPMFSGMGFRAVLFTVLMIVTIGYVLWYGSQIKKNPKLSGAYIYDKEENQDKKLNLEIVPPLKGRQVCVIVVFIIGIVFAVLGVVVRGYYVDELTAIFLVIGIIAGLLGGLLPSDICRYFVKGAKEMLLPAFMIGLASGGVMLLENANVLDTVLHSAAGLLEGTYDYILACGMFIFHALFNVVVPSGSVQANYTMPLMTALADSAGITRQTAVLAYQLGDAFTNVLAPTGGEILAALAICKVPFGKWVRFLLPIFLIWVLISLVFIVVAVKIGFGPF